MRLPVDQPYQITGQFGWLAGYPLHTDGMPGAPAKPGVNYGYHIGTDFVSDNKRVYLTDDATIQVAPLNGDDGNAVYYNLGNKRVAFCHLASFAPGLGNGFHQAGTFLGIMGETGYAEGVHLHLAVAINGIFVDPLTQIQGGNMSELSFNGGDKTNIQNDAGAAGKEFGLALDKNSWNENYYNGGLGVFLRHMSNESPFNEGDVVNISNASGIPQDQLRGLNWNQVGYKLLDMITKLQGQAGKPTQEQQADIDAMAGLREALK